MLSSDCDFSHLADVVTNLSQFDLQSWGELASRLVGSLISDGIKLVKEVQAGFSTGDYSAAGKTLGKLVAQVMDSSL